MERFQLIRKMYLQGTISMSDAIILASTDEERQEIRDLRDLFVYKKLCDGIHNGVKYEEIDSAWSEYTKQYERCDAEFYLYMILEMSRTNNITDYCDTSYSSVDYLYADYNVSMMNAFNDLECVNSQRDKTQLMTIRERIAYSRFSTHAKEREIAEEWIAGNIVSVPRGLDYNYTVSHYHSLLPHHPH